MINEFNGYYRFLSNFYRVSIYYEGIKYPSVEHAYQAAKTDDPELKAAIADCAMAGQAKRLGNAVDLKEDWDQIKLGIMNKLLRIKFNLDLYPELCKQLLSTGIEYLVEGNTWGDTYWGVCRWSGRNHLGRILMDIRSELKKEIIRREAEKIEQSKQQEEQTNV